MTDDAPLENITKAPPIRRGRPPLHKPDPIVGGKPLDSALGEDQKFGSFTPDKGEGFELYASVPKPTMRAMELKRHYKPTSDDFEIVGYNQPEIKRKGPDGRPFIVQEAAFIPDVMAPSPMPGVDVKGKIWATTIIRVSVEEARRIRANGIGDAAIED